MRAYAMELIGTFFLMLAVSWTQNPLAIGAMLAVIVYIGAQVSGGHYNPAVTLGMYLQKKVKLNDALFYMAAQVLGAFFASAYFAFVTGSAVALPPSEIPVVNVFSVELIFAFLFVMSVIAVSGTKYQTNGLFGFVIGTGLMAAASFGGTYNPALNLGPTFLGLFQGMTDGLGNTWAYVVAPLAGGALASYASNWLETK